MNPQDSLFVLVHDAWHRSWAWQSVAMRLQERGWSALAIEASTNGDMNLTEYADAIVQKLQPYAEHKIILVGHGTGGPVIQLVADKINNVAGLIFVQAYVLKSGESIASVMSPQTWQLLESLIEDDKLDLTKVPDLWRFGFINDNPKQADEYLQKLVAESSRLFTEPIHFDERGLPSAYISFNEDMSQPNGLFHPQMANKLGKFRHVNINASHEGILTKPREVAEVMIYLAAQAF